MEQVENLSMKQNIVLGILAHVDAGKTTLSEQMLFQCGALRSMGRVDHGDTFLDTDEMEKRRGITIFSKQAELKIGKHRVTLLDTPGHVDFSAEMERCLQVLDYAILVVSAADGVQGHTQTLWRLLEEYQVPTFIFVNKVDQQTADKTKVLAQIKEKLSQECIDFSHPSDWDGDFFEALAMTEETLLDRFLEGEYASEADIKGLICDRRIFPVYFGSALKNMDIDVLLDGLGTYFSQPVYGEEFGARVFKITRDVQGNRLTHLKITGGSLKVKSELKTFSGERAEKINQIRIYHGDKFRTVDEAFAGEICQVTGLTASMAGEGLGDDSSEIVPVLEPVLSYRIRFGSDQNVQTVLSDLRRVEEESPELHIDYSEETSQIWAQLMGDVQIEILKNIMEDRFGYQIEFDEGEVLYRETIGNVVEGVGHFEPLRHYAEVHLLLEPLPRGSGMVFDVDVRTDDLATNWQRLIFTHLNERMHRGVLTRSPITDMKITLKAGKAHNKHTEGGDFRQATYRAVRQGLMQAENILLEPYYAFRITVPAELLGRVLMDVEQMSGKLEDPEVGPEYSTVSGKAPVSLMRNYAKTLAAYSKGKGRIALQNAGYEVCHNTQEVLETKKYNPTHDLHNTPDSVFCGHGSSVIVPWDEVKQHMHLPSILEKQISEEEMFRNAARLAQAGNESKARRFGADQEELMAIFEKTYGKPKRYRDSRPVRLVAENKNPSDPKYDKPKKSKKKDEYLLVDGYNIVFAWEELAEMAKDNIDAARGMLADMMCNYQGTQNCHLLLVFDAYKVKGNPGQVQKYHNIEIIYTKEAETADQYIEKMAHSISKDYNVTVATSDGLVQLIVWGEGCRRVSAREFRQEVESAIASVKTEHMNDKAHGLGAMEAALRKADLLD